MFCKFAFKLVNILYNLFFEKSVFVLQFILLEIFNKRASFESRESRKTAITDTLILMFYRDNMPIRTVEKEGFVNFIKTLPNV